MTDTPQPSCEACKDVVESPSTIHVIRKCSQCGRELRVVERGAHGIGIKVEKGDRIVIPPGALEMSLNPLKGKTQFTRVGLQWYWHLTTVDQVSKKSEEYLSVLDSLTATTDKLLEDSPMLTDLDLDDPVQAREALLRLDKNRDSAEWFASLASVFAGVSRDAIASGDAMRAAWAATLMERFRAMMLFKTHLEEVVWMGHGARRLVEILRTWDANRTNADEEFWQITFSENAYVLSQVLGVPIVFIEGKAFVGGMTIEGKDSRFVDYLFAVESSGETVLVEIKTPVTPLLGKRKYRNVYQPSAELGGSIVQLLDYRSMWLRKYDSIAKKPGTNLNAFNPRCVLLIGDAKSQFKNVEQRHALELFRSNQKDVEIIAYDELFSKVRILASIFNLVQRPPDGGAAG